MATNIFKRIICWIAIVHFLFSIYLEIIIHINSLLPLEALYIATSILTIIFEAIAIRVLYLWQKNS